MHESIGKIGPRAVFDQGDGLLNDVKIAVDI